MSIKGNLTREDALKLVGSAAVDKLDSQNVDFTGRYQMDGDTRVEFSASLSCQDKSGETVTLTAYYYQESANVHTAESLDDLRWTPSGYEVT